MAVVATAGHVDHGKSTLVRLLTGTEPDRLAQERERGLTIDLGYAWTDLDGVHLSLVDVPGHERFAANMLAGLGPVAGVMFVVAADAGWARQSEEHARAVVALGLRQVLLVVTRCDLVEPATARAVQQDATGRLAALGLSAREAVRVSGRTGEGLPGLRAALRRLALAVAAADPATPVRLWLDRAFTVRGVGTVATGTLTAGTLRVEDELLLRGTRVRVRGLHSSDRAVDEVRGPARVAVNLRGVSLGDVARGDALLDPRLPAPAAVVDVTTHEPWLPGGIPRRSPGSTAAPPDSTAAPLDTTAAPPGSTAAATPGITAASPATYVTGRPFPRQLVLHVGTAAVTVHVHVLPDGRVRLRLRTPLPLAIGDRGVLRDPGLHEVRAGIEVVGLDPPRRRTSRSRLPVAVDQEAPGPELPRGKLVAWLAEQPLVPPTRAQLEDWGITAHLLARAERTGQVTRVGGLVLAGDAVHRATETVRGLDQPFRPGDVATALPTSRRVAIALLERLDTAMVTRRLPDGSRMVR